MIKKSKIYISITASLLAIMVGAASFSLPASAAEAPLGANNRHGTTMHCPVGRHGLCAMQMLAELSGKSVKEISGQYPQRTAWQAAKEMGKLDDLKKAYLSRARVLISGLVDDKRISSQDGDKMYADITKRVTAIDGVNIVIPGKPNFKAQFQDKKS